MEEFSKVVNEIKSRSPWPSLFPNKPWKSELNSTIKKLEVHPLKKAVLFLMNDDLELCHRIAQDNENSDGNYCHAVLHRREKDFDNSKYWYRRVGEHLVLSKMSKEFPKWDALDFVEKCRSEIDSDLLRKIQWQEMSLLLEHILEKDFPE